MTPAAGRDTQHRETGLKETGLKETGLKETGHRDLPHPETAELVLTEVLFALSDPVRLEMVRQLAHGPLLELPCHELGGTAPKSTRSHHLKTLREAGVIRNVPLGRERRVSLRREDLEERFPGLLAVVLGR